MSEDGPTIGILAGLHDLERAGAGFIAMACNTVHIYYDALAAALTTPLLNMITVAVKSIPPTANAVGLIAACPTTESGIYQDSLRANGYTVLDHGWQDQVDHLLGLIRDSPTDHELTAAWRPIMEPITAASADCVLVACLELTAVIRHSSPALTMIDAGNSLAAEIVRRWLHQRQPGARSLP